MSIASRINDIADRLEQGYGHLKGTGEFLAILGDLDNLRMDASAIEDLDLLYRRKIFRLVRDMTPRPEIELGIDRMRSLLELPKRDPLRDES